ncbi:immunoglobulin lambda-1 light chain-like, partial [Tachysurus ichikawai]
MIKVQLRFILSLLWLTGVAGANDVLQPKVLWAEMGQSCTINCSHTKGLDYNQMYWFRQQKGESMELIVYTTSYGTLEFGNFNQRKFSAMKPDPGSGSLTVRDVDYNDSSVYICA